MKKFVLLLLCISLLLGCCSCGGGQQDESDAPGDPTVDTEQTESADEDKEDDVETQVPELEDVVVPEIEVDPTKNVEYYQNPIIAVGDKNTWPSYGVGDPFVMRYNGRYYLYCSTKDGQLGIQCWTSDDLVDWTYAGLCASEALTTSAYAPEVVYYNGSFYMYTSPAGNGHYVLKSDAPTGPFVAVTGNLGLSIDGDVFIDDDGSWYFYSAASDGIMVYTMSAPDQINASSGVKIPCDLHGWTEGSMIVKHDGLYYMTYTGNHVWSAGYRINYAVSDKSPLKLEQVTNNPLLLSTDRQTVMGIGHSSTVLGPNLDEYYIVYHSFKTAPMRSMNIDRIVFNGTATVVLGATTDNQQRPAMPDLYSRFEGEVDAAAWSVTNGGREQDAFLLREGGKILSTTAFGGDYTAEINLTSISGKAGVIFDYSDKDNYATAVYHGESGTLTVSMVVGGKVTRTDVSIRANFGEALRADALISFTVRKSGDEYTLFVNNREVFRAESGLSGGALGVVCESGTASVGFVGVTNGALQSTLADVFKPVESSIPAFTCTNTAKTTKTYNKADYLVMSNGAEYEYRVNISDKGLYDIVVQYRASSDCVLEVYQKGERIGEVALDRSGGKLLSVAGRGMTLARGLGTVTLRVKEGTAELLEFSFHKAETVVEKTYDFSVVSGYAYKDGSWKASNGALLLDGQYGKYMVGSENWGNYVVESDITITADSANAGLCVRVSNPSTLDTSRLYAGTDFLQGYFIGIGDDSIFLGKHNYDWKGLTSVAFRTQKGQTYRLRVEVKENEIRVSVDGKLVLTYTDTDAPFLHGMVGYRVHSSGVIVDNLTVAPIQ